MELGIGNLTLFGVVKKRLAWLTQRQEVLAQNIANSDSPRYRPRDLKPFRFKELIRRENAEMNLVATGPGHLAGRRTRIRDFAEQKERLPYETAPDGNAVILEEQMQKINESGLSHRLTTELYKRHLNMFRMALGRQG